MQKAYLEHQLNKNNWQIGRTADAIKISKEELTTLMETHGLKKR
jgi:DNA-binding NtrC family response regulator